MKGQHLLIISKQLKSLRNWIKSINRMREYIDKSWDDKNFHTADYVSGFIYMKQGMVQSFDLSPHTISSFALNIINFP
jgi:hypothetical protein